MKKFLYLVAVAVGIFSASVTVARADYYQNVPHLGGYTPKPIHQYHAGNYEAYAAFRVNLMFAPFGDNPGGRDVVDWSVGGGTDLHVYGYQTVNGRNWCFVENLSGRQYVSAPYTITDSDGTVHSFPHGSGYRVTGWTFCDDVTRNPHPVVGRGL